MGGRPATLRAVRVSRDTLYAARLAVGMVLVAAFIVLATPSPATATARVVAVWVACVAPFVLIGFRRESREPIVSDPVRVIRITAVAPERSSTAETRDHAAAGSPDLVDRIATSPIARRLVTLREGSTAFVDRLAEQIAARHPELAPVVVPLSTFDGPVDSVVEWFATAVAREHGVTRQDVLRLIEARRLVALLDGLDEIPDRAARSAFLAALTRGFAAFVVTGSAGDATQVPAEFRRDIAVLACPGTEPAVPTSVEDALASATTRAWSVRKCRAWLDWLDTVASRRGLRAVSYQRLPLLFGPTARITMRVVQAAVSGVAIALPLWPTLSHEVFVVVAGALAMVFAVVHDRFTTRTMIANETTAIDILRAMRQRWGYAVAYAGLGAIVGLAFLPVHYGWFGLRRPDLFTTTSLPVVLAVTVLGVAMFTVVPALSSAFAAGAQAGRPGGRPIEVLRSTVVAAIVLAAVTGSIAVIPIGLVLDLRWRILVVPMFVLVALNDCFGRAALASALWAVRRRGPWRINLFLECMSGAGLLRTFGPFYLL
jgi:hypothetical protein